MNTQFDITFILSKNPCYDPTRYLPEGWKGSVKGILRHRDIPAKDKLWVVLRKDLIDDKTLRLFAVACARRALTRIPDPDPRSIFACDVAERVANGIATRKELALAYTYATDAATTAYATAAAAAYATAAAAYTADAVAYTADAARAAADAAAYTTYTAAAAAAAGSAAYAAADYDAADAAERQWQINHLIAMLEEVK